MSLEVRATLYNRASSSRKGALGGGMEMIPNPNVSAQNGSQLVMTSVASARPSTYTVELELLKSYTPARWCQRLSRTLTALVPPDTICTFKLASENRSCAAPLVVTLNSHVFEFAEVHSISVVSSTAFEPENQSEIVKLLVRHRKALVPSKLT